MDFDSFITFILIVVFFILPSILKQIQARKKKGTLVKAPKKSLSLFGRINEQIQQFVKDLEKQAQQQKMAEKDPDAIWEILSQGTDAKDLTETPAAVPDFSEMEKKTPKKNSTVESRPVKPPKTPIQLSALNLVEKKSRPKSIRKLRNAIVWSEILSKPVALRK